MKIPIVITLLFLVTGVLAHLVIIKCSSIDHSRISNIIQMWAFVAAAISATFVIYSFIHTNNAFILSQKPYLLLVVVKQSDTQTVIHYANKSSNPFYDLTIRAKVTTSSTIVNLDNLFYPNMYMAPQDSRNRKFNTKEELAKRGFNMDDAIQNGQEIILSLSYEHTFNKKLQKIKVQEYIWEQSNNGWAIRFPTKNL